MFMCSNYSFLATEMIVLGYLDNLSGYFRRLSSLRWLISGLFKAILMHSLLANFFPFQNVTFDAGLYLKLLKSGTYTLSQRTFKDPFAGWLQSRETDGKVVFQHHLSNIDEKWETSGGAVFVFHQFSHKASDALCQKCWEFQSSVRTNFWALLVNWQFG